MKKHIKILIILLSVLLFLFFSPYLKAEYLTLRFGDEFVGLEQKTGMLNHSRYCKVLSYGKEKAKVFYVSDTGDLITFYKTDDGRWEIKNWETIWSESGSADSFMWPYYR